MWYLFLSYLFAMFLDKTSAPCAEQRGMIGRENGSKIKLVSANYGRTDEKVSPSGKTHLLIKNHLKSRSSGIATVTCY